MNNTKYKPCPFCGNTNILPLADEVVTCDLCGGVGDALNWNNRPFEIQTLFSENEIRMLRGLARDHFDKYERIPELNPFKEIVNKCTKILKEMHK